MTATARTSQTGKALMAAIKADGKVAFDITIDIRDAAGETVAEMKVNWYVSPKRS